MLGTGRLTTNSFYHFSPNIFQTPIVAADYSFTQVFDTAFYSVIEQSAPSIAVVFPDAFMAMGEIERSANSDGGDAEHSTISLASEEQLSYAETDTANIQVDDCAFSMQHIDIANASAVAPLSEIQTTDSCTPYGLISYSVITDEAITTSVTGTVGDVTTNLRATGDTASDKPMIESLSTTWFNSGSSDGAQLQTAESSNLIHLSSMRSDPRFAGIDGSGYSVVIIDTGGDLNHPAFGPDSNGDGIANRIVYQYDFSGNNDSDASDTKGHGTNVAGIIGSQNASYLGMAPAVNLIILKVFPDNSDNASNADIEEAAQWVVNNVAAYNIVSVNLSLGGGNFNTAQMTYLNNEFQSLINLGVAPVVATGNNFRAYNSEPGVASPAADSYAWGVGAVYDANIGQASFPASGAIDYTTAPDRVTSFTQRTTVPGLVDLFAPGGAITNAFLDGSTATLFGTSMAAPHIAGIVALAQEYAVQISGNRMPVNTLLNLMRSSATTIVDGDDENDNVTNTGGSFPRIDVYNLMESILSYYGSANNPGSISVSDISITEGNSGSQTANFTVTRSGGTAAFNVNFATADNTATAGSDYVATSGTLSFGNGVNSRTVSVTINGDTTFESSESFFLNLSGATGGATITDPQAIGTILNDDPGASSGSLTINDVSVVEGNNGTTAATFTITRTGGTAAFAVNYATADGTAASGSDYVAMSGTLSFATGVNTQTITVTVNGNTVFEPNETFFVNLSAATNGATISDGQGQGTIINDDPAPAGDDFADNITDVTAPFGQVTVGGSATGNLETMGDRDWFRVSLTGGGAVTIDLEGQPTGVGTLVDPYLFLYDSAGQNLIQDDDTGAGYNSQISYTPTSSGTYYISAAAFNDSYTGTYSVRVAAFQSADDYADNLNDSTAPIGQVSLGGTVNGNIETLGDKDWIRVNLTAGITTTIDLEGLDTGYGSLSDPYLYLYDSAGQLVYENDDSGYGLNSQLVYTSQVSGSFYIVAGAYGNTYTGTYRVNVTAALPDLSASVTSAASSVAAGGTLSFAGNTFNTSNVASAGASLTQFFLSTDTTINGLDRLIGSDSVPALAGSGNDPYSTSVTVPVDLAPGTYWLGAVADAAGVVTESNEANNTWNMLQVTVTAARPDLSASVTSAASSVAAGGTLSFAGNTFNTSNVASAGASLTQFFLSTDTTINGLDRLIGSDSVPALAGSGNDPYSTSVTVPVDLAPGIYWLGAVADAAGVVTESNEANNTWNMLQVTVTAARPDLSASVTSAASSVAAGGTLSFAGNTFNTSNVASAGASLTQFFLSTDTTINGLDRLIGSDSVPALAGSGNDPYSTSVTVPVDIAPGTYWLGAVADAAGVVTESNEANNTWNMLQVTVTAARPDLSASVTSAASSVAAGGTLSFAGNTFNTSNVASAGASLTQFFLSTDTTINGLDRLIGSDSVPALAGSGNDPYSTSVTVPVDLAPGIYWLGAVADAAGVVTESNEANNTWNMLQVTVTAARPDLSASVTSAASSVAAGGTLSFAGNTFNTSNVASAGASLTQFFLSTDTTINGLDRLIGSDSVPALAGSGNDPYSTSVTVPVDIAPGTYWLGAVADAAGVVTESNEANNTWNMLQVTVTAARPDLSASVTSAASSVAAGGTLSFAGNTFNTSNVASAGASLTQFFLSTDTTINGLDRLIGSDSVPALAGSGNDPYSTSVTVPVDLAPGIYWLGAVADAAGVVTESNEANNTWNMLQVTVTAARPDLSASVTSAGVLGGGRRHAELRRQHLQHVQCGVCGSVADPVLPVDRHHHQRSRPPDRLRQRAGAGRLGQRPLQHLRDRPGRPRSRHLLARRRRRRRRRRHREQRGQQYLEHAAGHRDGGATRPLRLGHQRGVLGGGRRHAELRRQHLQHVQCGVCGSVADPVLPVDRHHHQRSRPPDRLRQRAGAGRLGQRPLQHLRDRAGRHRSRHLLARRRRRRRRRRHREQRGQQHLEHAAGHRDGGATRPLRLGHQRGVLGGGRRHAELRRQHLQHVQCGVCGSVADPVLPVDRHHHQRSRPPDRLRQRAGAGRLGQRPLQHLRDRPGRPRSRHLLARRRRRRRRRRHREQRGQQYLEHAAGHRDGGATRPLRLGHQRGVLGGGRRHAELRRQHLQYVQCGVCGSIADPVLPVDRHHHQRSRPPDRLRQRAGAGGLGQRPLQHLRDRPGRPRSRHLLARRRRRRRRRRHREQRGQQYLEHAAGHRFKQFYDRRIPSPDLVPRKD